MLPESHDLNALFSRETNFKPFGKGYKPESFWYKDMDTADKFYMIGRGKEGEWTILDRREGNHKSLRISRNKIICIECGAVRWFGKQRKFWEVRRCVICQKKRYLSMIKGYMRRLRKSRKEGG